MNLPGSTQPDLKKIPLWRLVSFFEDLAYLLKSGLPLLTSLSLLENSYSHVLKYLVLRFKNNLQHGLTLSQAWQQINQHPLANIMMQAAEQSGKLTEVLFFLRDYAQQQQQLRQFIWQTLRYPLFLIFLSIVLLIGMCQFIVPQFAELYQSFHVKLPNLTQLIIQYSYDFSEYLFIFMISFIVTLPVLYVIRLYAKNILKKIMSAIFPIKQRFDEWHFWHALSLLLNAGIPFLTAAQSCYSLLPIKKQMLFLFCLGRIQQGSTLSTALTSVNIFNSHIIHLCLIGETSGQLTTLLINYVSQEKQQLQKQLEQLKSWFEPLLLCSIGILIGTILLALYLPMVQLGKYI